MDKYIYRCNIVTCSAGKTAKSMAASYSIVRRLYIYTIHTYMYVDIQTHMNVYIYIYIYIYTHTHRQRERERCRYIDTSTCRYNIVTCSAGKTAKSMAASYS